MSSDPIGAGRRGLLNLFASTAMGRCVNRFRRFVVEARGSIAVQFTFFAPVLVISSLFVVDYASASRFQAAMQNAVDAATLAAARAYSNGVSEEELDAIVSDMIDANLKSISESAEASDVISAVSVVGDVVEVTARAGVPNLILGAFDFDGFDVSVDAAASSDSTLPPLDVVLVVDVSGSMGSQLEPLRNGIRTVAQKLHDIVEETDDIRIGIVPYAHGVNIGSDAPQSWLDANADNPTHGVNFEGHNFGHTSDCGDYQRSVGQGTRDENHPHVDPDTSEWCHDKFAPEQVNHFTLYDSIDGIEWEGCVEARPNGLDETDDAPNPGDPATLFVPFFAPDEPDFGYANSWAIDRLPTGEAISFNGMFTWNHEPPFADEPPWAGLPNDGGVDDQAGWGFVIDNPLNRMAYWRKYKEMDSSHYSSDANNPDGGPNWYCPPAITPLTNSEATITGFADNLLDAYGSTHSNLGLVWGWRVASPSEPFTEGGDYGERHKIVIFMTDGDANLGWGGQTSLNSETGGNSYGPYGYVEPLGSTANSMLSDAVGLSSSQFSTWNREYLNAKITRICDSMKAESIELFTMIFDQTGDSISSETEAVYQNCASGVDDYQLFAGAAHYYRAESGDELVQAFADIAESIRPITLVK